MDCLQKGTTNVYSLLEFIIGILSMGVGAIDGEVVHVVIVTI